MSAPGEMRDEATRGFDGIDRSTLKADPAGLMSDLWALHLDMTVSRWTMGFSLAMEIAILLELFLH